MTWTDHSHSGEYAPTSHSHDRHDVYGTADEHHWHDDRYANVGHDHDRSELWSAIADLQNTVEDLGERVATLAPLAAHDAAKG